MEGARVARVSVAAREVNAHSEVDLTATHYVVQERVGPYHLYHSCVYVHVLMRDEKEGRKKQAKSNKQQGKATQHTHVCVHREGGVNGNIDYKCISTLYYMYNT